MRVKRLEYVAAAVLSYVVMGAFAQVRPYKAVELSSLPGGNVNAHALNNHGHVTGESGSTSTSQAFLHSNQSGIVDINGLGYNRSAGWVINDDGVIAGVGFFGTGAEAFGLPFRYTPAGGMNIMSCFGGTSGAVTAINAAGDVVGYWDLGFGAGYHSFIFTADGGFWDLGTLGGAHAYATALNGAKQVAGYAYLAGAAPNAHAFLWEDGEMDDLGTLGGSTSYAHDINEAGLVVGSAVNSQFQTRPFMYTQTAGMSEVPLPPDATFGEAWLVNDAGVIAGRFATSSSPVNGFQYSAAGGFVDFGNLDGEPMFFVMPRSMNAKGAVVGQMLPPSCFPAGFVWTRAGGMVDLNRAVAGQLDWDITDAVAINDAGQILVTGNVGSYYKAALLTPKAPRAFAGNVSPKSP